MRSGVAALLLLAGCDGGGGDADDPGARIEAAAIASGAIADPARATLAGAYGRGADRLCIMADEGGYRIGADVTYGGGIGCTARGTATQDGEDVAITLDGADDCRFTARFDGASIAFPGSLPGSCAVLCDAPASFAGLTVDRLSGAAAEVQAMRGAEGGILCGAR